MKKAFVWLLVLLLLAGGLGVLQYEKKVDLSGERLPVLGQFEGKDWRGEKSWGFTTEIKGEEKAFEVYPGVFNSLVNRYAAMINLAEVDDQSCATEDHISFEYLGSTKEDVHVFYIFNFSNWFSSFLFVEIEKNQGAGLCNLQTGEKRIFYEDQVLIRKVGTIPLGSDHYDPQDFVLEGDMLRFREYTFHLSLKPPSSPKLMTKKLPFRFDQRPFVTPFLAEWFIRCVRSGNSSVIALDLVQAQNDPANWFFGKGFTNDTEKRIGYRYQGVAKNGIHVVHAWDHQVRLRGQSHLFFLYEKDYELRVDWENKMITRDKERTLLKKVGELELFLSKPFVLEGNTISYTDTHWKNQPCMITGAVEHEDVIMEIELNF